MLIKRSYKNSCSKEKFEVEKSKSSQREEVFNFVKKETLTQVFPCEFCDIFKNTFFIEYLRWLHFSQFHTSMTTSSWICLFFAVLISEVKNIVGSFGGIRVDPWFCIMLCSFVSWFRWTYLDIEFLYYINPNEIIFEIN